MLPEYEEGSSTPVTRSMRAVSVGGVPDHQGQPFAPIGGTDKAAIAHGTAVDTVVKEGWARLCRVIVTAPGAADVLIYDGVVSDGVIIGAIPGNAPMGAVYDFLVPAILGICVAGHTDLPGLTITYY